ncbi:SusC/RagA family TonB-linked outer membrane protein [Leeuwenhoekiella nanhaiensis]|uniref:SusC/RagA family protein n=1 Tax=Leeuwenhoekiella nanhaiensis TaxID=1655491 RepID=A0A2G1VRY5_9FLAO|nr:TonB-dependent receptor [Leeuwenhoekiella nanhaiensis]PHQ29370.1 SusC/RagA family protein [Leeuwenhoekiella nanhaiensis]
MRSILSFVVLVLFSSGLLAQTGDPIQASGTVTDMTGMPLPGVNVIVKGTSRGTSTNFDGEFSLSVPQSGTLVFSYLGFQPKEVVVTSAGPITVQLVEDASALEEVVVIGYGTQTRKEVTGAVAVVGSETIEEQNPVRIEQALQGRVAGVNISSTSGSPGSASTINIRGISTNGDNRPLILVDGARIEDLSVLNPNDIESINILKDATAGIYGVLAANGVILITTKTGRKNSDLRVNVDSYVGLQETTRKLPVLNATEYGAIINEAFVAGNQAPPFPNLRNLGMGTDWQDQVFRQALLSDVNATAYAGGEKSAYSIGLGYLDQDGIVGGSAANFERFTGRGSYSLDITDNLKFKASGIYTNSNRSTLLENVLGSVLFNAVNMDPTKPVYDANGDFTLATGLGNEVINPVAQIANTFNRTQVDKITGSVGLSYEFFDNFKIESNYQFNYSEVRNRAFTPSGLFYGDGKVFNNIGVNQYFVNDSFFRDYTWDNLLTYTNTIADDHNITALLGTSAFRTSGEFYNFTGRGVPGNTFAEATLNGAEEVIDARDINGPAEFDQRLLSYFARLQYGFKEKYLFSALVRRDGSSNFGPENKFGTFYSLSGGWVISEEAFFDSELVNFAKFRGSYGSLGNDRIGAFGFVSTLNGEGTYVFDNELVNGVAVGRLSNPEIKWESQKSYDIGLDLELFNSAVKITADYFNKRTEDLLLTPQVSGILGVSAPGAGAPIVNAGSVENKGFEFSINYNQIISDDADFNIGYNLTTLKNEVLQVGNESGFIPGGAFGFGQEAPARMKAGFPIGYFYGLQTNGIFQTQAEVDAHATQANAVPGDLRYVDQNGDGVIDGDDRINIGDPIPDVTMGLNLGFNYKNFDFTAYAYASIGNDIVRAYDRNQNLTNKTNYVLNRWIGPGSTDTYPRVTIGPNSNLLFSDFYVEDGSYLRLQNVQLGYSLGSDVIEQLGISKLRFYVAVANAFTLTEYQGFDPSASSGAPIGGGIDQGFYPVPRIYTAGLNFKF